MVKKSATFAFSEQIPKRILTLFSDFPSKKYSARGIARDLKLSHATTLKYLKIFQNQKLIIAHSSTLYRTYSANIKDPLYIFYKKNHILEKILRSNLIDYIVGKTFPSSIFLFGSCAKGSFNLGSDIDIFIESKHQDLKLGKYEKILGKKIHLLFEKDIYNLPKELWVNVVNGQLLYGYLQYKKP
tara:strand:+ start:1384 stop:1938 length:555 start_codon:yes stop_codon:yes gene_type:complete